MKKFLAFVSIFSLSAIPGPSYAGPLQKEAIGNFMDGVMPYIHIAYDQLDAQEKRRFKRSLIRNLNSLESIKPQSTGIAQFAGPAAAVGAGAAVVAVGVQCMEGENCSQALHDAGQWINLDALDVDPNPFNWFN